ncbi:MAG: biotin--[acetyl-CoA-carboxylase] ligase [Candidatus Hydrogenedentes bacterium]|nr:biotin--[acetyl-CoA-carboxylase] ligase [Candidatus Hydrogenedentota bacterium]
MSVLGRRVERVVFSLPRIKRATFVRQAELHRSIDSTNNRAMEIAANADIETPFLVIAETQTAGRGRGSNVWWSAPGAVTFSLVMNLPAHDTGPESWPRFALATAVAVCEALEAVVSGKSFGIRWPNDVFYQNQKICGILPELCFGERPRLVLGVGINANNSLALAPAELRNTATSLIDLAGRRINLTQFVSKVLCAIEARLADLTAQSETLPEAWAERCLLRGSTVTLKQNGESHTGRCEGIDSTGALLLKAGTATKRFYGGTIAAIA